MCQSYCDVNYIPLEYFGKKVLNWREIANGSQLRTLIGTRQDLIEFGPIYCLCITRNDFSDCVIQSVESQYPEHVTTMEPQLVEKYEKFFKNTVTY